MTAMAKLKAAVVDCLQGGGVAALEAFPSHARRCETKPVALVSVKDFSATPLGLGGYVGEHYHEAVGQWEEVYGQRVQLCFLLTLYAPKSGTEADLQDFSERLCDRLYAQAPAGLSIVALRFGDVDYDGSCDMLRRVGELSCEGLLYAARQEDGNFLDFEVKGGLTT